MSGEVFVFERAMLPQPTQVRKEKRPMVRSSETCDINQITSRSILEN